MQNKKITSALISVFDKDNLEPLVKELIHNDKYKNFRISTFVLQKN